ncbi:bifunctional lysylphosphatidylglycerol flippase/synthetase MprF [Mangrovibrevibacter kandeliae]|uniref:bifunctional lysylphosphatidylglycerol flippase/synthetase MprF n=1 Tax=Mangrovibrevibacter kandeliae TaxID=2968473 RepID=UPI0021184BA7|nr:bifunctional lysylphosphatidylglycerol flippase/synthetase MprF [Aurantimonas sp. CSK15Z-1]MCQ8783225.1 bifunctional lysylphosphatidylglycerol flippase/synthetase MprF [Aurantimonas sp. CSK15Z-1]
MTSSSSVTAQGGRSSPGLLRIVFAFLLRYRAALVAFITLFMLLMIGVAIGGLTQELRYHDVVHALRHTPWSAVVLAMLFTAGSFAALSFYDVSAIRFAGAKLPYPLVAITAFSAYAVGNIAGFGPLSGGAIRYRLYTRFGIAPEDVGRIIAFVTGAFGLGLAVTTGVSLLIVAPEVAAPLDLPAVALRLAGVAALLPVGLLLVVARRSRVLRLWRLHVPLPEPGLLLRQIVITSADILAASAVLYVLLPDGALSFPAFVAIYAVAIGLGVVSHVPGGVGVFETVILATVGQTLPLGGVLGALVLYRIVYYVLPLVVAAALVGAIEARQIARGPAGAALRRAGSRLSAPLLSTLTLVLGGMLILSGVTPTPHQHLDLLSDLLPLPILEGAHFLASLLGLVMLVVSRGLSQRLDGAWWAAVSAASAALVLTLAKAIALYEAAFLVALLLTLVATRRDFDRPASLLRQALSPQWLLAVAIVLVSAATVLFFVYRDVEYSNELWWQFEFSAEAPRSLRALLGVVVGGGLVAGWSLLRPALLAVAPPDRAALDRAVAIAEAHGLADANLVRMGDKSLIFSEDGDAFIMFARQNRSWVALFDPIGPRETWPNLIWRFVEEARAGGGRAIFYQVTPAALSIYADAGMRAYKLGESASVDLPAFSLKGGRSANLRNALNRGERDGLTFEMVPADAVAPILPELAAVSDAWLEHREVREKGFSLGAFRSDYVTSQPVALIRHHGEAVAFATLLVAGNREEMSVDLMRFRPGAPNGTMEYLFVQLITHARDSGYRRFDLGMAPLAGLSDRAVAPAWDRIGRIVFERGERFYNFRGLRAFKAKFSPQWEPRYLVVSSGLNPAVALADVTMLIGGGLRGVLGK